MAPRRNGGTDLRASGLSGFIHVGLGTAERAEIRGRWPDGEWSHSDRVFANSLVRLERGKAAAELWLPEPLQPP
jgi:enediyne biosynthesis protein E4